MTAPDPGVHTCLRDERRWIDVQVGTDFLVQCDCGWGFRTKSDDELHARVNEHEATTGHRWPSSPEEVL